MFSSIIISDNAVPVVIIRLTHPSAWTFSYSVTVISDSLAVTIVFTVNAVDRFEVPMWMTASFFKFRR